MKKLALLLAVIGIVFSSCNGKYTIAKRKYNKGFYVNRSGGNHTNTTNIASNKTGKVSPVEKTQEEVLTASKIEPSELPGKTNEPVLSVPIAQTHKNSHKTKNPSDELASNNAKTFAATKTLLPLDINKHKADSYKKGGDVDEVILIILCIFIPFLAVYLYEDKIAIDFWIDLLLCLLFWLPGIIFAFLVCFAGVSL